MADMEFDLGEALGGYEQAQADRNFYLSMVQGGTQTASPIAAYLAGVSGVKMANMRQQVQDVQDARQAKLDATEAADKAQKRRADLVSQLTSIAKGVSEGTIPASVGATLVGPIGNELGIRVKQYIPEEGKIVYNEGNDPTDLEWGWRENPSVKEKGLQSRAEQRIDWEREKQERGIQGQKEVASYKESLKEQGSQKGGATVSNRWQTFKTAYGPLIDIINGKDLLNDIKDVPDNLIEGFIKDYDEAYDIGSILEIVKAEKQRRSTWASEEKPATQKPSGVIGFLFGK